MAQDSFSFTIPTLREGAWGDICPIADISITPATYVCEEPSCTNSITS